MIHFLGFVDGVAIGTEEGVVLGIHQQAGALDTGDKLPAAAFCPIIHSTVEAVEGAGENIVECLEGCRHFFR